MRQVHGIVVVWEFDVERKRKTHVLVFVHAAATVIWNTGVIISSENNDLKNVLAKNQLVILSYASYWLLLLISDGITARLADSYSCSSMDNSFAKIS